jgi:peptidoglycan/LPS O-acetylase OafA/YrhL
MRFLPASARPESRADFLPKMDGFRALAITAVLFDHAFPEKIPGGFLGVDIFLFYQDF